MAPRSGGARVHHGLDFSGSGITGADVRASESGTISFVGVKSGYGNTIIINHDTDGTTTLYAHLKGFNGVKVNDFVAKGSIIGFVGNTGIGTGPHLHFEIRFNNAAANPAPFLGL